MATGPVTFEDLLVAIYDAAADTAHVPDALVTIADHFGTDRAILADGAGSLESLSTVQLQGREDLSDHHVRNYTDGTLTRTAMLQPVDTVRITEQQVQTQALHRTACPDVALRPQKMTNMLVRSCSQIASERTCSGIGPCLCERIDADASARAASLEPVSAPIVRAIDLLAWIDDRGARRRRIETFLEVLAAAALALDGRGCVIAANRRAETLLAARDGIMLDRNRLAAVVPDDRKRFQAALADALVPIEEISRPVATVRLQRPEGIPLAISFMPLRDRARLPWADSIGCPRALVMIADPSAPGQDHVAALQAGFGLTKAEARVASLIGGGTTAPEAALQLRLSPGTIKTHLARIFQKTGVRNQAGISRLLAALPVEG